MTPWVGRMGDACMGRKRSFTLIELLVVVAIIAVLISLLLPALGNARVQAKTAVCMSNLRQVGMGIINYTSANNNVMYISWIDKNSDPRLIAGNWVWALTITKDLPVPQPTDSRSKILMCPLAEADALARGAKTVNWTYSRILNYKTFWEVRGTAGWVNVDRIENPSRQAFLVDGRLADQYDLNAGCPGAWYCYGTNWSFVSNEAGDAQSGAIGFYHGGKANILFSDWHVEGKSRLDIPVDMFDLPE